jgi:hypothetical protein
LKTCFIKIGSYYQSKKPMRKEVLRLGSLAVLGTSFLLGCSQNQVPDKDTGILEIRANGEDFVREGFVSKDGWIITFDKLYVNLAEVTAYQTTPPYNAETGGKPQPQETVLLVPEKTVDLAEGDETAAPILVAEVQALPGRYNALSWKMLTATEGPAAGYSLVAIATATKDGLTIPFTLKIDEELEFTCGEFVGDDRKGILPPGGKADLEATFHFDHLFGDGEAPPEDEINTGALGFAPLAALAENGKLEADSNTLQQRLSPGEYQQFQGLLSSLGHVGEGHCHDSLMVHRQGQ